MNRLRERNINTPRYWLRMYETGTYPSRDSNNMRRFHSAASLHLGETALDIGGGEGVLGECLSPEVYYTNLDYWQGYSFNGRLPFPDKFVDTVYALEVLEHLEDPESMKAEMERVAIKRLVVSIPYRDEKAIYSPEHIWHMERSDFPGWQSTVPNSINIIFWRDL